MYTVAFTGHREINGTYDGAAHIALKGVLKQHLTRAIDKGFTNFISGMALGFDMLAAEAVLDLQLEGAKINLIAAIPYQNQTKFWKTYQLNRYHKILERIPAELKHVLYDNPTAGNTQGLTSEQIKFKMRRDAAIKLNKRNAWMITASQAVIAAWTGVKKGGTWNAVEFATNKKVPVLVIHPTLFTNQWLQGGK